MQTAIALTAGIGALIAFVIAAWHGWKARRR